MKATFILIFLNIISFFLQLISKSYGDAFLLVSRDVALHPWTLITTMFLHGDFSHLLFNMVGLFFFGILLEDSIGVRRFLAVYFTSGILASIAAVLFYPAALGASGALMGILGVLVILMPNLQVLVSMIVPMPLWMASIVWVLLDTMHFFFPSNVAGASHLMGLGTGMLLGLYYKQGSQKMHRKIHGKKHLTKDDMEAYMKTGRI